MTEVDGRTKLVVRGSLYRAYDPLQYPSATFSFEGSRNDLTITARQPGAALEGVQVNFVNRPTTGVVYDATARVLTVQFAFGTTAADVVSLFEADRAAAARPG